MDDYEDYRMQEFLSDPLDAELRRIAEEPVFGYLARYGDAIEARVNDCLSEGKLLLSATFPAASVIRTAAGIEISLRFFLARPLLQGAFLSDEWSELLSRKFLNGRTAEDRDLLPAILRNWGIDITAATVSGSGQLWDLIVSKIWPRRNDCVHKGAAASVEEAQLAIVCLEALLREIVDPLAIRLGFTRDRTQCWSTVARDNPSELPDFNPPIKYER